MTHSALPRFAAAICLAAAGFAAPAASAVTFPVSVQATLGPYWVGYGGCCVPVMCSSMCMTWTPFAPDFASGGGPFSYKIEGDADTQSLQISNLRYTQVTEPELIPTDWSSPEYLSQSHRFIEVGRGVTIDPPGFDPPYRVEQSVQFGADWNISQMKITVPELPSFLAIDPITLVTDYVRGYPMVAFMGTVGISYLGQVLGTVPVNSSDLLLAGNDRFTSVAQFYCGGTPSAPFCSGSGTQDIYMSFDRERATHEVAPRLDQAALMALVESLLPAWPSDSGPAPAWGVESDFPGFWVSGVAPIPEPSTLTLLALGISVLAARGRRSHRTE